MLLSFQSKLVEQKRDDTFDIGRSVHDWVINYPFHLIYIWYIWVLVGTEMNVPWNYYLHHQYQVVWKIKGSNPFLTISVGTIIFATKINHYRIYTSPGCNNLKLVDTQNILKSLNIRLNSTESWKLDFCLISLKRLQK